MIIILLLALIVPVVVYIGLSVFHSVSLTFLMYHFSICLVIPIVDLIAIKKLKVTQFFGRLAFDASKTSLVMGVVLGLIYFVIILLFFYIFNKSIVQVEQIRELMITWKVDQWNIYLFLLVMIVANSILEEVYWRGYIFSKLEKHVNIIAVIFITSFFYSSYHLLTTINLFPWIYSVVFTLVIFAVGCLWGYLRHRYNTLIIPIISHLFADLAIMLIYLRYIH